MGTMPKYSYWLLKDDKVILRDSSLLEILMYFQPVIVKEGDKRYVYIACVDRFCKDPSIRSKIYLWEWEDDEILINYATEDFIKDIKPYGFSIIKVMGDVL